MRGVQSVMTRLEQVAARTQAYVRKHWKKALAIREKIRFSEEAFHLILAGGVGVIGWGSKDRAICWKWLWRAMAGCRSGAR